MVDHAVEIGWTPLSPEAALTLRAGAAGMLFPSVRSCPKSSPGR